MREIKINFKMADGGHLFTRWTYGASPAVYLLTYFYINARLHCGMVRSHILATARFLVLKYNAAYNAGYVPSISLIWSLQVLSLFLTFCRRFCFQNKMLRTTRHSPDGATSRAVLVN